MIIVYGDKHDIYKADTVLWQENNSDGDYNVHVKWIRLLWICKLFYIVYLNIILIF